MKVAVIHNRDREGVINPFGRVNRERYSQKAVERVAEALEVAGHNVRVIEGNMHVVEELQNFMPRVLAGERLGMVFNMAYGIQGESRYTHVPAMLEMLGIPYVGSGPAAHAIALDKVVSKVVFQQHQLPTPKFWVFDQPEGDSSTVEYPVIVKPKMEAVSHGLTVARDGNALKAGIKRVVDEYQEQALVEAFIPGREFAVGLLGNGDEVEVFPVVEIDLEGDAFGIQTKEDKMQRPRTKVCPAPLTPQQTGEAQRLARACFRAIGCFDFARIDLRMDSEGRFWILELNSMASLGRTGSYVHAAGVAGYSFEALIARILEVASRRYPEHVDAKPPTGEGAVPPLHVRVRSYVRRHSDAATEYLRHMVAMESYVYNVEAVNALGSWLSSRLSHLGFRTHMQPQTEVGSILYCTNHEREANDVLLLGHLDVPQGRRQASPYFEEHGRCYGAGVAYGKGGLAVMLSALHALRSNRKLRNIRCGVLLTTDESVGGKVSREVIRSTAERSSAVLAVSSVMQKGALVTSAAGTAVHEVEATADPGDEAPPVIESLARTLIRFGKSASRGAGTHVVPLSFDGRAFSGKPALTASATVLTRFETQKELDRVTAEYRRITKRARGGVRLRMTELYVRPGLKEGAETKAFFGKLEDIGKELGVSVSKMHRMEASQLAFAPPHVPAVGGFGPNGNPSATNEYIVRDSLIDQADLLSLAIAACER
ncbi:MAG TPA: M20/M25/M40 family metallo-hydrolase [Candidatus Thermoplasmatota archaeon]